MKLAPEFCILLAIAAALVVFGALRTRPVAISAEPSPRATSAPNPTMPTYLTASGGARGTTKGSP